MQHRTTRVLAGIAFVTVTVAFAQQAHTAADLRSTVETQHTQVVTLLTEEGQTSPTIIPTIEGPDGAVHTDCAVIAMSETGDGSSYVHCSDGWEAWS